MSLSPIGKIYFLVSHYIYKTPLNLLWSLCHQWYLFLPFPCHHLQTTYSLPIIKGLLNWCNPYLLLLSFFLTSNSYRWTIQNLTLSLLPAFPISTKIWFHFKLVSHSHKNSVSCTTTNLLASEIQVISISLSEYHLLSPLQLTSSGSPLNLLYCWIEIFIPLGCRLYLYASLPLCVHFPFSISDLVVHHYFCEF